MKHFIFLFVFSIIIGPNFTYSEEIIIPADNYPPWKIAQNDKIIGGIDTSIIKLLLNGLDLTPRYELRPWERCLLMMKFGHGDLISGITLTQERQDYLAYLHPPYKTVSQKLLFVQRGMKTKFLSIDDMENRKIGVLRGAKYFPEFDNNLSILIKQTDSDLQGLEMVFAHRLDGFIMTKENAHYLLSLNPHLQEGLEIAEWRYEENIDVYLAISRKSPLLKRKNELEARLKLLIDSGKIEGIIQHYLTSLK